MNREVGCAIVAQRVKIAFQPLHTSIALTGNFLVTVGPLKVTQFQNEFMKSSFLPKYKQKIVKVSALTT